MAAHNSVVSAERKSVSQCVLARRSVRAFLPDELDRATVEELLELAARAPSGGNLQPWHVDVLTGDALAALKVDAQATFAAGPAGEGLEFTIYPSPLPEPYRSRRFDSGEALYATLDMDRDDKTARLAQFARNYDLFGAPVGLFFSIDRLFDRPQWAHLGMFMQNVMLLAEERGLATCPQEAWAAVHETVARHLQLPADRIFYCAMALGKADPAAPVNRLLTDRSPLRAFASLRGF
ncbi:MAG TPA: nitroreductase [Allosphingosinicella sp.]|nr:nitroreductase [Allosphingosinicella sp.]